MNKETILHYFQDINHAYNDCTKHDTLKAMLDELEQDQDTVPFDFDLYQAGLMDMPKEMIKVLDEIRAEIADIYCGQYCENPPTADSVREMALQIIDKYKAESEE